MGLGSRIRAFMTGAVVLVSAASAVVVGASGASADAHHPPSIRVTITNQSVAGSACNWTVTFNVTITNRSSRPVTVTGVDAGSYAPLNRDGGLAAGTVLRRGTSTFTNLFSGNGTPEGQPCPPEAPDPLVLTVNTSAGSVTWNQSVSDPQAVTMMALPQGDTSVVLAGSFDVANCSKYYFVYGTTAAHGHQVGQGSAKCPNDGTTTQTVSFTVTNLRPGTGYHYRFVVVERKGTKLRGKDVPFQTGGTQLPIGSVGLIGLAALAGCALFIIQLRRRSRRSA